MAEERVIQRISEISADLVHHRSQLREMQAELEDLREKVALAEQLYANECAKYEQKSAALTKLLKR